MSDPITLTTAVGLAFGAANKLGAAGKAAAPHVARAAGSADSLIKFTQPAQLNPIVMVDRRAALLPEINDGVKTLASLFIAYYLQSIALDTEINGVKVVQRLQKFATDRDALAITSDFLSSLESRSVGLQFGNEKLGLEAYYPEQTCSLEAKQQYQTSYEETLDRAVNEARLKRDVAQILEGELLPAASGSLTTKDITKLATDITNLAVGKLIEVKMERDGMSATIPVSFRQRVLGIDSDLLVDLYSLSSADVSLRGRWRMFRAGEINFSEFATGNDRIQEYYANALKDKTGYYRSLGARQVKHKISGIAGQQSLGMVTSSVIMHEQTASELETRIGGPLDDFRIRQRIFEGNLLMLMMVIDPTWETVTIYHRGIPDATELNYKAIKDGGKADDKIVDILRAFQLGQAPGRI